MCGYGLQHCDRHLVSGRCLVVPSLPLNNHRPPNGRTCAMGGAGAREVCAAPGTPIASEVRTAEAGPRTWSYSAPCADQARVGWPASPTGGPTRVGDLSHQSRSRGHPMAHSAVPEPAISLFEVT